MNLLQQAQSLWEGFHNISLIFSSYKVSVGIKVGPLQSVFLCILHHFVFVFLVIVISKNKTKLLGRLPVVVEIRDV